MPATKKKTTNGKKSTNGKTTNGKTTTAAGKKPAKGGLRVRMYRVGFGDFFLVTVPSPDGPQHILVDCGVTRGKTGKGDIATIKTAVRHMADETGSKLALIIVTHRHQDHIIGFSRCADVFSKFQVGAVWMPYWETEYAPKVAQYQADLTNLAVDLRVAALAGAPDDNTSEILGIVENATGMSMAEGPGGGTNARSLDLLKRQLGVKPEYYARGDKAKLPPGLVKAGLSATILGPPPDDGMAFLKLMDLQKTVGQYAAPANGSGASTKRAAPFDPAFIADATAYPPSAFREWAPRRPGQSPDFSKRYPKELEAAARAATPEALFTAAKQLDAVLNNQSLVVLFEWKGKKLLFAGDAQGGNWENWLFSTDKPMSDPSSLQLTANAKEILQSLDFYKVGHHGSTNATPIPAVDAMGPSFVAMCSTEAKTFGSVKNKSEVPRVPLLEALEKKSTLVRSDQIAVTTPDGEVPATTPEAVGKPFVVGDCYVDYML
jgi:beta-lactamase superfamily II metal-dependent hydrolase